MQIFIEQPLHQLSAQQKIPSNYWVGLSFQLWLSTRKSLLLWAQQLATRSPLALACIRQWLFGSFLVLRYAWADHHSHFLESSHLTCDSVEKCRANILVRSSTHFAFSIPILRQLIRMINCDDILIIIIALKLSIKLAWLHLSVLIFYLTPYVAHRTYFMDTFQLMLFEFKRHCWHCSDLKSIALTTVLSTIHNEQSKHFRCRSHQIWSISRIQTLVMLPEIMWTPWRHQPWLVGWLEMAQCPLFSTNRHAQSSCNISVDRTYLDYAITRRVDTKTFLYKRIICNSMPNLEIMSRHRSVTSHHVKSYLPD